MDRGTENTGRELARLRIAAGLSRRQLAVQAGVASTTVTHAEAGREIARSTADALAKVLGPGVFLAVRPKAGDTPVGRARWLAGLTTEKAAMRAGVSLHVWQQAEAGRRVHPRNAAAIARAFELDPLDVLPFEGKGTDAAPAA